MSNNVDRRKEALAVRERAARLAHDRNHPDHLANGDEQKYASAQYLMSFTKGLDHDPATGLVKDKQDFEAFRLAIDNGFIEPFTTRVPVLRDKRRRVWEAPTAGTAFDLEGPDAQAVTMPPAPTLCSDELTFEMAEVYELALVRDVPFKCFDADGGRGIEGASALKESIKRLNILPYATNEFKGRPRKTNNGKLDGQTVFRGSSPGSDKGPYLSQFMLIGNADRAGEFNHTEGLIQYGVQLVDQRVPAAKVGDDYMVDWNDWLEVQQGYNVNAINRIANGQSYTLKTKPASNIIKHKNRRFITTPRDLATYVHFDALYQAYLNACLILLGDATPFDPAFDVLSGVDGYEFLVDTTTQTKARANAGGFALYGGPHILSLVTEVATRALKAVRFQKFNNHIRCRPEVLAARIEKAVEIEEKFPSVCGCLTEMEGQLKKNSVGEGENEVPSTLERILEHNTCKVTNKQAETVLLPMAFAEGSPMHPAYGAGHATVAGACVTILKAFFDTSAVFAKTTVNGRSNAGFFTNAQLDKMRKDLDKGETLDVSYIAYQPAADGSKLEEIQVDCPLTLEGELNKLAANISIGRNMAGVHYFSDYFDSVRMGEKIAIGILEEQALGYPTDPFVLSVPTFDGDVKRIGRR
ncbi:MAG: vanadium-dependent haloperoxidase [Rhizobiaceae bacterium]|nr:vanadium-dependent haloperoxidase [Rhizobiaceae bacterium]